MKDADLIVADPQESRGPDLVSQAIVEKAQTASCDKIVMVTHGLSRVGKFIFGSHTKDVIIESRLPVLVLRDDIHSLI